MIQILRNDEHLGLSCVVHNYTRPNGCSTPGISDSTVPDLAVQVRSEQIQIVVRVAVAVVLIGFVAMNLWPVLQQEAQVRRRTK